MTDLPVACTLTHRRGILLDDRRITLTTVVAILTLHFAAPASAQTAASGELPLVWVLSTGGTISGQGATSTSLAEYKSGALLSRKPTTSTRSGGCSKSIEKLAKAGVFGST